MARPAFFLALAAVATVATGVACGPSAVPVAADPSKERSSIACDGTPFKAGGRDYCAVKTRRPFQDAAKDCERMRGRLAVIDEATKNGALVAAIGSPWGYGSGLWLGCSDVDKEGSWLCDGKPMGYANWSPGQPDNQLALDDCSEWLADTGQWNDASCDRKLGYVCRGDKSLACKGKPVLVGGAVFCAHGEAPADWDGAKKACEASGGKLAVIASADEARALFEALKLPSGLPSWQPSEGVWIGLSDATTEGKFVWANDAPPHFMNWAPGQPNDAAGGEDCATLSLGDGTWNDADCATPLPYVCEAK